MRLLRGNLWRNGKVLQAVSASTLAVFLTAAAILNPGVKSADVELNDGGVWVTNKNLSMTARLNYPSKSLDGGVTPPGAAFDVVQDAGEVFVNNGASLTPVDPAAVRLGSPLPLPGGISASAGFGTMVFTDPAAGKAWVAPADSTGFDPEASTPAVTGAKNLLATVGTDGAAFVAEPSNQRVSRFTLQANGSVHNSAADTFADFSDAADLQLTSVGSQPVLLDRKAGVLFLPGGRKVALDGGEGAALQQPGPDSDFVAVATKNALIRQPLNGSTSSQQRLEKEGVPARPVQLDGCVHSAWNRSNTYLRDCRDNAQDKRSDVPMSGKKAEFVFRVNRRIVVLNDVNGGDVWLVQQDMQLVNNWQDLQTPQNRSDEEKDDAADQNPLNTLPDRSKENREPHAQDDDFGVRPGKTTLLTPLDNDSDPDGDMLSAKVLGAGSDKGRVEPIYNDSALQIAVPKDASGSSQFAYQVDDGRGKSAQAKITVRVRQDSENGPPAQKRNTVILLEQGRSISQNVLSDWADPDGDDLFLKSASVDNGSDQVRVQPDGLLQFQDVGTTTGRKTVTLRVSDGRSEAEGRIVVEVRPRGTLPPVANPDHVLVTAGENAVISPLDNDQDPSGTALRLARVDDSPGATVTPQFDAGTFLFNAAAPGTYYVTYQVTNGPASQLGLVRVDVTGRGTDGAPVAVRDVARLPQGGQTLVDALANDIDPAGGVLVIQSVSVPAGSPLSVALLDHSVLRVSDSRGITAPETFGYTVSNGRQTAKGEVTVQPVPAPARLRPPQAVADEITVRVNDVGTIPVLGNDSHPDNAPLTLKTGLAQGVDPADGIIAVSGDTVRFKAGPTPKTVHAIYVVAGPDGQESSAQITIRIKGGGTGDNSRPEPKNLTARTIAGSTTRIQVPLDGIDPDGDSVSLIGLEKAPAQGTVKVGASYLEYTAAAKSAGQDSFSYVVQDTFGVRNTATVSVGIAPESGSNQLPVAGDDQISVLPGRDVAVDVLRNDSDPDGDPVALVKDGIEAEPVLAATVEEGKVRFTSPSGASAVVIHYQVTDGRGGVASGVLRVNVSSDVLPVAPVANDDRVSFAETLGKSTVEVPVLKNDEDPDGVLSGLAVALAGDAAGATVGGDGRVTVAVLPEPRIIPYTVTDPDGLAATAFIHVPGTLEQRPALKSPAPLEVMSGEELVVNLNDAVVVRKDRSPRVTVDSKVSAVGANGQPLVKDVSTLSFTSADDYAGPASLAFEVADGPVDAPGTLTSMLTISINVLPDPNRNHAPEFSSTSATVVEGEESLIDLGQYMTDPDAADQGRLKAALAGNQPPGFATSLDGNTLKVRTTEDAEDQTGRLSITVTDPRGLSAQGTLELVRTPSRRPLPVANDDVVPEAKAGENRAVDVLANDDNPFPDSPLSVVSAVVETGEGNASVAGNAVDVRPSESFVGTMVVRYRIADKTADAARQADGRIRLTVKAKPDKPGTPVVNEVRDKTVVLSWTPPSANGSPITGYRVTGTGGVSKTCATNTCTVDGLTNDVEYTFSVIAVNAMGDSPTSDPSAPARPDQRPEAPQAPVLTFGDRQLGVTWEAATTTGSAITDYELQLSPAPPSGAAVRSAGPGLSYTWTGLANGTSYRVQLRAKNKAPTPSDWSPFSAAEVPAGVPAAPAKPSTTLATSGSNSSVIQVSWVAPDGNGAAVSEYTVVARHPNSGELSQIVAGSQTSAVFNVGNSDTGYTFTVAAKNKAGYSAPSVASDPRRAVGAPGPVNGLRAEPLDNSAQLFFTAPSTNGGAAAGETVYEYRVNGGAPARVPANNIIPGLANNGTYTIGVRATNVVDGQSYPGPYTDANPVAPYGKPGSPSAFGFHEGHSMHFIMRAPEPNGRPIVQMRWVTSDGQTGSTSAQQADVNVGNGPNQRVWVDVTVVDSEGQMATARGEGVTTTSSASISRGSPAAVPGEYRILLTPIEFPPGTYTVLCYSSYTNNGSAPFWSGSVNFPSANGQVELPCSGHIDPARGEWLSVEVRGIASAPRIYSW